VRDVLPALARLLGRTEQRDVVTAGMVAMAKIGRDHSDFRLGPSVFAPRLRSHDQEVRETAALALGIAGLAGDGQIELLADLARDAAAGRKACGRAEVDGRTRAFACYALGLFARGGASVAERFRAVAPLVELVRSTELKHRDVESAAILALGLLGGEGPGAAALRALAVDALADRLERRTRAGDEYAQAQAPVAIARLLDPSSAAADVWRRRFADELQDRRRGIVMAQSCALALGALCRPCADDRDADASTCAVLLRAWREHGDAQTRNFAIMGLGRSRGAHQRELLLAQLDAAGKAVELPWVALALGVHASGRRQAGAVDRTVAAALRDHLQRVKNPGSLGALAIAVGLCGDPAALDDLRLLLLETSDETLAGHACIGLALLGDRSVVPDLQGVLRSAARRPVLLQKAAIGLGVLGDKSAADELLGMMRGGEPSLARLSAVAVALGFIGDRRTLAPLLQLCDDESLTALTRAFGVAALGGVCDRHRLPWNTDLRDFANYRATVDTLWDGSAGVLDIL
jgi:HEAT repeat protein